MRSSDSNEITFCHLSFNANHSYFWWMMAFQECIFIEIRAMPIWFSSPTTIYKKYLYMLLSALEFLMCTLFILNTVQWCFKIRKKSLEINFHQKESPKKCNLMNKCRHYFPLPRNHPKFQKHTYEIIIFPLFWSTVKVICD